MCSGPMSCCFARLHMRLGTSELKCPWCFMMFAQTFKQTPNMELIRTSEPDKICVQFHSKLGNGCFTSFCYGILITVRFFFSSMGRMRRK